jgi:hypothetical protein
MNAMKLKVKLLKGGHVHAGKPCAKDEEIEVTERQAEFLAKRGLIAQPGAAKAAIGNGGKPGDATASTK